MIGRQVALFRCAVRRGKGTSAALALPLLRATCNVMRAVAPLSEVVGAPT